MEIIQTKLADCFIIKPTLFEDSRGFFYESFNQKKFESLTGVSVGFVQDNQAKSNYGILRGLHFQQGDDAQAKLVSVLQGKVLDVAVDIRPNSNTYGEYVAVELSGENHLQLFVPRGFAHGYSVLENNTLFFYKCDNYYCKEAEGGVIYNDAQLNIDWKIPEADMILSDKDKLLPKLA
ncbi:MAG: dTDP-4-dehydrorhamnose 3,5-epimerase [Bacteroidetes bacterium]|nr:dTDP-4-dehydrorhamnose 3,5-epimerase [Bacteroidota bacterium]